MRCAGRLHLGVLIVSQRIRPTSRYEWPGEPTQPGTPPGLRLGLKCSSRHADRHDGTFYPGRGRSPYAHDHLLSCRNLDWPLGLRRRRVHRRRPCRSLTSAARSHQRRGACAVLQGRLSGAVTRPERRSARFGCRSETPPRTRARPSRRWRAPREFPHLQPPPQSTRCGSACTHPLQCIPHQ